jgi:hypothetical protein
VKDEDLTRRFDWDSLLLTSPLSSPVIISRSMLEEIYPRLGFLPLRILTFVPIKKEINYLKAIRVIKAKR